MVRRKRGSTARLQYIGLGALSVLTAGALWIAFQPTPTPEPTTKASDYLATWKPESATVYPYMAIVGDSFAVDTEQTAWPSRTARCSSHWLAQNGRLGTGFWNDGDNLQAYWHPDRVAAATRKPPALIILESSYNDSWRAQDHRADVEEAIVRSVEAYRAAAPKAKIVILGPLWAKKPLGPGIPNNQAAMQAAAERTGVTYINAVDWLPSEDYTTKDGMHPSDAGHTLLAGKLLVALKAEGLIESTGGCESLR